MEHNWVDIAPADAIPALAVVGGYSDDGESIYVGRGFHAGCVLPANIIPNQLCAYIAWEQVNTITYYQILVGEGYHWVPYNINDEAPANAVRSGEISSGHPVYVGRCNYESCLMVGNIIPPYQYIFLPYGNEGDKAAEIYVNNAEILVKD